jgi:hypothetical protein
LTSVSTSLEDCSIASAIEGLGRQVDGEGQQRV